MQLTSKFPAMGTTIFTRMTELAIKHNAINLAQGFPDYDIDPLLAITAAAHIGSGPHQYAPMAGTIALREAIAHKIFQHYTHPLNPVDQITITAGATQALHTAITSLIHHGEEVIVFEPAYDSYVPAIQSVGGIPVYISLQAPHFIIDWELVTAKVNNRTKMIIINTPMNPATTVWTADDYHNLHKLTEGTNIVVLSDEVYEHLTYTTNAHKPIYTFPHLADRSLSVYSFGKSLQVTGWKIGYIIGPPLLMAEYRKMHQYSVFAVNHPAQSIIAKYLETIHTLSMSSFFEPKLHQFQDGLRLSKFTTYQPQGTYFMLANYSAISELSEAAFCEWLTIEKGVAAIPLSVFYNDKREQQMIRFCFAKKEATLNAAIQQLCKI